jgi:hypothetical protein
MRMTNGIPLGSSLLLPVHIVNFVATMKAEANYTRPTLESAGIAPAAFVTDFEIDGPQPFTAGGGGFDYVNIDELDTEANGGSIQGRAVQLHGTYLDSHDYSGLQSDWHGARFPTEIYTRGCHWIPRMFASSEHAYDQWHSSRKFTFFTS